MHSLVEYVGYNILAVSVHLKKHVQVFSLLLSNVIKGVKMLGFFRCTETTIVLINCMKLCTIKLLNFDANLSV